MSLVDVVFVDFHPELEGKMEKPRISIAGALMADFLTAATFLDMGGSHTSRFIDPVVQVSQYLSLEVPSISAARHLEGSLRGDGERLNLVFFGCRGGRKGEKEDEEYFRSQKSAGCLL